MEILPTDPSSSQSTQEQTSPKKTLRDSLRERVSNLWKTIAESRVIPFSARRFFTRLEGLLNETMKRIGYALQGVWPDLFRPSSPADPGKESVLYVLRRFVDDAKEPLVPVGAFQIGEQVAKDIPRTYWPLSYQSGVKQRQTYNCSQMKNTDSEKSEKILQWLQERLQSEPKLSNQDDCSQAITNLSSILFHQSVGADIYTKLTKTLTPKSQTKETIILSSNNPYSDACVRSTETGLTIKLTWEFTAYVGGKPEQSIGTQKSTRTISIPWEELTVDWQKHPPASSKITVQDQVHPFSRS